MTTNTTPGAGPVTHSPLPWEARDGRIVSSSRYVATVDDWSNPDCAPQYQDINGALKAESEANARLIVEAVNSHARLLAEREKLRKALEAIAPQVGNMLGRLKFSTIDDAKVLPAIRAALKETEGQ